MRKRQDALANIGMKLKEMMQETNNIMHRHRMASFGPSEMGKMAAGIDTFDISAFAYLLVDDLPLLLPQSKEARAINRSRTCKNCKLIV